MDPKLEEKRVLIQKRTLTNWSNSVLSQRDYSGIKSESLKNDLKDGRKLLQLLEILTEKKFIYHDGLEITDEQKVENLNTFLEQAKQAKVKCDKISKLIKV